VSGSVPADADTWVCGEAGARSAKATNATCGRPPAIAVSLPSPTGGIAEDSAGNFRSTSRCVAAVRSSG